MARLLMVWTRLRSSLWFLPFLVVTASVVLAFELIALDESQTEKWLVSNWPRFFATDPDGARAMLSAIASSMITVAGVVFSITIVALSLTSTQYSPRVLRNFMRDTSNQVVLGAFVGVFAYCLVVLRNVTGVATGGHVPSLAVLAGFVLSMGGIGFLIYFIHHIATSIQATEMVATIAADTIDTLEKLYPERRDGTEPAQGDEQEQKIEEAAAGKEWQPLPSTTTGYIQTVDLDALFKLACRHDWLMRIEHGTGEFVVAGRPLVSIAGLAKPEKSACRRIRGAFAIDSFRTIEQDPAFGVRQILDIALKALSPGINDTGTAITCLDYLSAIFCFAIGRRLNGKFRYEQATLRILVKGTDFRTFSSDAIDQILESSRKHRAVLEHLLTVLGRLSAVACSQPQQREIREKLEAVAEAIKQYPCSPEGKDTLEEKLGKVRGDVVRRSFRSEAETPNKRWGAHEGDLRVGR